jgi:hypothetical protein
VNNDARSAGESESVMPDVPLACWQALMYMQYQAESGTCCPMTMTFAGE